MARNPLIEAIHGARYDLETSARHQRAACQRKLDELLRQALERVGSAARPEQLLDALFDDYREFKRARSARNGRASRVASNRRKLDGPTLMSSSAI